MKSTKNTFLTALVLVIAMNLYGQTDSTTTDTSFAARPQMMDQLQTSPQPGMVMQNEMRNIVKVNLAPLLLKSYSVQYERVINRKISVALQYRIMPETGVPFKSDIQKLVGDEDPDTKKIIEDFRMSNYAITPEVRIYLSRKGYGHGFYFAPFYRYASFSSNGFNVFYTDDSDVEQSVKMAGKLTSNTFGFMLGVQSSLGKRVLLDWSLLGPHFGSAKGTFNGDFTKTLSQSEQQDLRQSLEDIEIPLTDQEVNVSANAASLKLDGPWAGFRFNFAIGFRF